jgi:hypothetical protein
LFFRGVQSLGGMANSLETMDDLRLNLSARRVSFARPRHYRHDGVQCT